MITFMMLISILLVGSTAAATAGGLRWKHAQKPLHFRLQFPRNLSGQIPIVDVHVCVHERLEDALSSVFLSRSGSLPPLSADSFNSTLISVCTHFPDWCDGNPPNEIISFNLFDGDEFIVRKGYSETQLLQCYCSKYLCFDDNYVADSNDAMTLTGERNNDPIKRHREDAGETAVVFVVGATSTRKVLEFQGLDATVGAKQQQKEQEQQQEVDDDGADDPFFEIYAGQVPPDKLQQYFPPINSTRSAFMQRMQIRRDDRIFVSIASYRDPQLPATVSSLLAMCAEPQKLTLVICDQSAPHDPPLDLLRDLPSSSSSSAEGLKVVLIPMHSNLARGPTWARHLIQQQWGGEQFYLQLDSHMRLVQDWDLQLKADLSTLPGEKACLSNYPPSYDAATGEVDAVLRGPMYATHIDRTDRFIRLNSDYIESTEDSAEGEDGGAPAVAVALPRSSRGWSGGFSFSSAQLLLDAPYDPHLPFLFFGEEMDILARLFTRGWQMFVPTVPVCFTAYDRSYRQTFWGHPDNHLVRFARMRLHHKFGLLEVQKELQQGKDLYYLGKEKTMSDFFEYLGLNESVYYKGSLFLDQESSCRES